MRNRSVAVSTVAIRKGGFRERQPGFSGHCIAAFGGHSRRRRDDRHLDRAPKHVHRHLHRRHRGQGAQADREAPAARRQVCRRHLQHHLERLCVGRADHQPDARRPAQLRRDGRLSADRERLQVPGDQEPAHGLRRGHRLQPQRRRQRDRRSGQLELLQARGPERQVDLDAGRQRRLGHADQGAAGQEDAARRASS